MQGRGRDRGVEQMFQLGWKTKERPDTVHGDDDRSITTIE